MHLIFPIRRDLPLRAIIVLPLLHDKTKKEKKKKRAENPSLEFSLQRGIF